MTTSTDKVAASVAEPLSLAGRVALVTGASGFIGSALARRLRAHGAEVHGTYRGAPGASASCDRWWRCNLEDASALRSVIRQFKPELIFHLASHVSGARGVELVSSTFQSNLASTVNLLIAAAEEKCTRLVLTGSMEEPSPDGTWPVPPSPYAAAKFAASTYARMFHRLYQTPVVLLRVFMVYGPNQRDHAKLIPYVARSLLKGEAPQLSSGEREVDWVYVDDVVGAYLAAASAQNVEGRTLDIGSGTTVSVRRIAERLAEMINPALELRFGAVPTRALEAQPVADVAETYRWTGWKPMTPLESGLRQTVDWYRHRLLLNGNA